MIARTDAPVMTIDRAVLKAALSFTRDAMAPKDTRDALRNLILVTESDGLHLIAADGFRVHESIIPGITSRDPEVIRVYSDITAVNKQLTGASKKIKEIMTPGVGYTVSDDAPALPSIADSLTIDAIPAGIESLEKHAELGDQLYKIVRRVSPSIAGTVTISDLSDYRKKVSLIANYGAEKVGLHLSTLTDAEGTWLTLAYHNPNADGFQRAEYGKHDPATSSLRTYQSDTPATFTDPMSDTVFNPAFLLDAIPAGVKSATIAFGETATSPAIISTERQGFTARAMVMPYVPVKGKEQVAMPARDLSPVVYEPGAELPAGTITAPRGVIDASPIIETIETPSPAPIETTDHTPRGDESYSDVFSAPHESTAADRASYQDDVEYMADVLVTLHFLNQDEGKYSEFETRTYGPLCKAIVKKYGSRSMLDTIRADAVKLIAANNAAIDAAAQETIETPAPAIIDTPQTIAEIITTPSTDTPASIDAIAARHGLTTIETRESTDGNGDAITITTYTGNGLTLQHTPSTLKAWNGARTRRQAAGIKDSRREGWTPYAPLGSTAADTLIAELLAYVTAGAHAPAVTPASPRRETTAYTPAYPAISGASQDYTIATTAGAIIAQVTHTDISTAHNLTDCSACGTWFDAHSHCPNGCFDLNTDDEEELPSIAEHDETSCGAACQESNDAGWDKLDTAIETTEHTAPTAIDTGFQQGPSLGFCIKGCGFPATGMREGVNGWEKTCDTCMVTIEHTPEGGTIATGDTKPQAATLKACGWKWSRNLGAWYIPNSRDRRPDMYRINRAAQALREHHAIVTLDIEQSAADPATVEANRAERLSARQDALTHKAMKLSAESDAHHKKVRAIADMIPLGQPILVGHHSEQRARKDQDRIHTGMGKAVAAGRAADETARRAESSEREQARRMKAPQTMRRIEKYETERRDLERRAARGQVGTIGGATIAELLADNAATLDYWRAHLATLEAQGVKVWTPADFTKGDLITSQFGLCTVTRVNAKSVSVTTHYSFDRGLVRTGTLPYDKVTGKATAEQRERFHAQAQRA